MLLLVVAPWHTAAALPPLGLTFVDSSSSAGIRPDLEIIGGTAYLDSSEGVWSVDTAGNKSFTSLVNATLGVPNSVTRVVDANGDVYVAANYGADPFFRAALFQVDEPTLPIQTWPEGAGISGISSNLRILGNCQVCDEDGFEREAAEFHLDGSINLLPLPEGSRTSAVGPVSNSGYGLGFAHIPGTLGTASALWAPDNEFSFVTSAGSPHSLRDRLDEQGVNIGFDAGPSMVKYGAFPAIEIRNENGGHDGIDRIVVSQSDFVVAGPWLFTMPKNSYGYYPGIVPGYPDRARPLLEIFPELATINIDSITDLAAVDGFIYMTIVADDGLYLFGARDPSVVPERTSGVLALLACLYYVAFCRWQWNAQGRVHRFG